MVDEIDPELRAMICAELGDISSTLLPDGRLLFKTTDAAKIMVADRKLLYALWLRNPTSHSVATRLKAQDDRLATFHRHLLSTKNHYALGMMELLLQQNSKRSLLILMHTVY